MAHGDIKVNRIMTEGELIDAVISWAIEYRDAHYRDAIAFAEWYAMEYSNGDKSVAQVFDYWQNNMA